MIKKMMLLAVSAATVVPFAVPATASATPLVHNAAGEPANNVTAVSENTVSQTDLGELNCSTVELSIALTENTTTTAHGSGSGAAFGTPPLGHERDEPCLGGNGHVVISRVAVNTIHLNDDGTGHASLEFDFASPLSCTVHAPAGIVYTPGVNTLSLDEGTLEGTPRTFPCTLLDGTISGDFTLQNGVTVG